MNKKLLIGKMFFVLGLIVLSIGVSYITTYYLDDMYEDINLLVTLEDTKEVFINLEKLTKEEVLKTYPYIFKIENKGKREVNYQIKIKDIELENIKKEELNYILLLNDEEVKSGSLSDLDNGIVDNFKIDKDKTSEYKLYIYINQEKDEGTYKYSLEILTM